MSEEIEILGDKAACPYGIDQTCPYAVAAIGVGGEVVWRLTPDEMRDIADHVESEFGGDE